MCVCILIKEFLRTVLQCCLPNTRYLPVSYVHNCNKRSYYKFYSQGLVGGHFGLKSFIKEVDLRLLENFTIDFSSSNEGSEVKQLSLAFYIFFPKHLLGFKNGGYMGSSRNFSSLALICLLDQRHSIYITIHPHIYLYVLRNTQMYFIGVRENNIPIQTFTSNTQVPIRHGSR